MISTQKSCITKSVLKHIILSIYLEIAMLFNFDLANELLDHQLSPQGCTKQDVSETSTVWDTGLFSNIEVQMQNQLIFPHFPYKPGKA